MQLHEVPTVPEGISESISFKTELPHQHSPLNDIESQLPVEANQTEIRYLELSQPALLRAGHRSIEKIKTCTQNLLKTCTQNLLEANTIRKFRKGCVTTIKYILAARLIDQVINYAFNKLSIKKSSSNTYLSNLRMNTCKAPLLKSLLNPFAIRAYVGLFGPILEEVIYRSIHFQSSIFLTSVFIEISREELLNHPNIIRCLVFNNAFIFGFAHAFNDSDKAYLQATEIFITEILSPSSKTWLYLDDGIRSSVGGHITNNMISLLQDDIVELYDFFNNQDTEECFNFAPIVQFISTALLTAGLLKYFFFTEGRNSDTNAE